MAYLTETETKFYEWLDQCPVPWFRQTAENEEFVSYNFTLIEEEEEEDD